ncbi:Zn-dependent amino-or carboxypeptidase, M28 family [Colwellia chukchiensis]|uniref:Zn-dependent amino-or carboxypeptidase, M28 family n=1 Tax=Colwellia chukchiensis TaxID=641665 RepID=A0A1H7U7C2_9GAMM|nr:M28 family metallopeptidase [Colwellia chukchiensis]SEL92528.1 Zn-dependent amino-or carboxypeptidase, M28 family [Colwellia chukchiensis]
MSYIREKRQQILSGAGAILMSMSAYAHNSFEHAYQSFDIDAIKADVKTLSSDKFAGREPATEGEILTTNMLISRFKKLGLMPGNGDSYLQAVPMNSIVSEPVNGLTIADISFEFPKNYVASSRQTREHISLNNSELVFVGYGINAPEYQWNDYKDVDVKGKTVVILVNDPGYATQDAKLFDGNTMTYYGRWTYKYEEAARQGAAGAIIVHETKPASYGWNVIESSWTGAQYHLPAKEVNEPTVDVEMWISTEKAHELMKKAGFDFNELKAQALSKDFKALPLKLTANIKVKNTITDSVSNNVIATIPGSKRADEHVIYMGHWDHLGTTTIDGKKVIFNGAHDNATGTAGLMHIAKAYKALDKTPERSVTFVAVTAEEQGRLGSRYFANHPTMPLNKVVGMINMDSLDISGVKKDLTVVGFGKSELEDYLAKAAKRQGRTLTPEQTPERGYYYRSDHFSLAKKGVPALSAGGGSVWLNAEQKAIGDKVSALVAKCYHQVCDEYDENWGWQGMVAELQVFFETGLMLSNSNDWPNWRAGSEFKATRDAMMK